MSRTRSKKRKRKPASLDVLDSIEVEPDREWADPYEGANDAQRKVIGWDKGNLIACCGPGAGKTFSVVRRIARMVRDGIDPNRILATTFTKKAAGEMNERLEKLGCLVGPGGTRVGTFHSVCLEIIRDGSEWANFEVDGGNGMRYALKDILGYKQMDWKGADLSDVEGFIGGCKNGLVDPQDVRVDRSAKAHDPRTPGVTCEPRMGKAYFMYEEERERRGLLTFDDMLRSSVAYLREDANARTRWAGRYDHVIVDEFQDSNKAQYELMKILADGAVSLLVVTDDDQCIYEWRQSRPEYTLAFAEKFSAETIRMEANYRSCPEILDPANKVIVHNNPDRIEKRTVAVRGDKGTVQVLPASDMDAEAQTVVERIMELHEDGVPYGGMSILYRVNAMSRSFEEMCIRNKVPHVVVGGTDFYSRKEIADILAYVRLAVDHSDDKSCARAINRPFRYIGRVSVDAMKDSAIETESPMLEAARGCGNSVYDLGLKPRQIASIVDFVEIVDALRSDLENVKKNQTDLPTALANLIRRTRYEDWIVGDEGSDTAENSRLSNLREMVRTSGRFKSAEKMLGHIDKLKKERKKRKDGTANLVQLSTIHRAKGLEWPAVFVVGCAESILPHGRSDNMGEERRLFYTAITRAMNHLMVTWPTTALVGGRPVVLQPSRFVQEAGLLKERETKDGTEKIDGERRDGVAAQS